MSEDKIYTPDYSGNVEEQIKDIDNESKSLANSIFDSWQNVANDRQAWIIAMLKIKSFIFGNQWSKEEKDSLAAIGQPDYIDNRLFPAQQSLGVNLFGKQPSFLYTSQSGQDVTFLNTILLNIFYHSRFMHCVRKIIESSLSTGVGALLVYVDEESNYGFGDVRLKNISIKDVYVPRSTKMWDWSDAPVIYYSKLMFREEFESIFNKTPDESAKVVCSYDEGYMDDVNKETDSNSSLSEEGVSKDRNEGEKEYVRIITRFRKVRIPVKSILDTNSGQKKIVNPDYDFNTDEIELIDAGVLIVKNTTIQKIEEIITAGNEFVLSKKILPCKRYPIIPLIFLDDESAYPTSLIGLLEGQQKLINKAHSIVLYNAQSGSNLRYMGPVGIFGKDTQQREQFAKNIALPNGLAEYFPTQPGEKPDIIMPLPLNNAFYSIVQDTRHEIEYISGQFGIGRGETKDAPSTWRATYSIFEWGQNQLSSFVEILTDFFNNVGDVTLAFMGEIYKYQRAFNVPGSEDKPVTVNKLTEIGNGQYNMENDVYGASMNTDIIVKQASFIPTYRWLLLSILTDLATQGIPVSDLIIENLDDVPDDKKKQIIERINAQQDIKQLVETLNTMKKERDKYFLQTEQLEKDLELEKYKSKLAQDREKEKTNAQKEKLNKQKTKKKEVQK